MSYDRRKNRDVLRYAVHCAIRDRETFLEAYANMPDDPIIAETLKDIAAFKRILEVLARGTNEIRLT